MQVTCSMIRKGLMQDVSSVKGITRDGGIAGIHNYMNLSPPGPNGVRQELGQKLLRREYLYSDSFLCNEL